MDREILERKKKTDNAKERNESKLIIVPVESSVIRSMTKRDERFCIELSIDLSRTPCILASSGSIRVIFDET